MDQTSLQQATIAAKLKDSNSIQQKRAPSRKLEPILENKVSKMTQHEEVKVSPFNAGIGAVPANARNFNVQSLMAESSNTIEAG